jgi:cell division protein FtsZ
MADQRTAVVDLGSNSFRLVVFTTGDGWWKRTDEIYEAVRIGAGLGATGVLVNITGGADLTLGEVHQINEIVHDAVGDDAEIIFGAVHEPAMQGEIRVTVIATGFDKVLALGGSEPAKGPSVLPFHRGDRAAAAGHGTGGHAAGGHAGGGHSAPAGGSRVLTPAPRSAPATEGPRPRAGGFAGYDRAGAQDLSDMEIPTFIRRQMD